MRKFGEQPPSKVESLPISGIDWVSHIALMERAGSALGRFDGLLSNIVNPYLLLSPITMQEAVLSSKIEGTVTTVEEVFSFEQSHPKSMSPAKFDDLEEVLNYRKALRQAEHALEKGRLDLGLLKSLHKTLMEGARGSDKNPGEVRKVQNYVKSGKYVVYTPPSPEDLPECLRNWQAYLDGDDRNRLVQLAILKAQFELIHPFQDGNGRIGRMLIPLYLYGKKLLSRPVFFMSAYLDENRPVYLNQLERISRNRDWDGWIAFFLEGVERTALANIGKLKEIIDLYAQMKAEIPKITKSPRSQEIVDALFSSPVHTIPMLCRKLKLPAATVARFVKLIKIAGVIKVMYKGSGSFPTFYKLSKLLEITERSGAKP